jgi:hypothetical protein
LKGGCRYSDQRTIYLIFFIGPFQADVFFVSNSNNHILPATTHVDRHAVHVAALAHPSPVVLMVTTIVATVVQRPFAVRDKFTGLLVGLIQQSPVQLLKGSDFSFKLS